MLQRVITAYYSVVSLISEVGFTPYLAGSVPWCGWLTKLNLVGGEMIESKVVTHTKRSTHIGKTPFNERSGECDKHVIDLSEILTEFELREGRVAVRGVLDPQWLR